MKASWPHRLLMGGLAGILVAVWLSSCSKTQPSMTSPQTQTLSASSAPTGVQLPAPGVPVRVSFQADRAYLLVEILDDDLVHFELSGEGAVPDVGQPIAASPMVAKTNYSGPSTYSDNGQGTLETPEMRIQVERESLCVTLTDKTKEPDLMLTSLCPWKSAQDLQGLTLTPETFTHAYGLGEKFLDPGEADGDWIGRSRYPGENGNQQEPWNQGAVGNDQFPVVYFAGKGLDSYALFLDSPRMQFWSLQKSPWKVAAKADPLRFYVMTGSDLQDLRQDYMELTGHPPVPPKKAFGLWISEYGFDGWNELKDKLRTLRAHRFPVDGFVLDLQWYGGIAENSDNTMMGRLDWNERAFPNHEEVIDRLWEQEGIGLVAIEQPYVGRNRPEHEALEERGFLVRECETCDPVYLTENPWWGKGGMLDFTNEAGAEYWHDWKREPLIEDGLVGHWTDLGEPELYDPSGWYEGVDGSHGDEDLHNLYNLLWSRSIYEGYQRNGHEQRPFILSRSGTSGSQRYGVAMWSGDISALLSSLAAHLNVQMHMSLSGIDYYGADIGGFWRQGGDVGTMYTVWFAHGMAFDIPGRVHTFNLSNDNETAPDRVGDLEANLFSARLRYELSPYLYSLAHRAYLYGEPVVPPLVYYYQDDPEVREMGSEKMLGRDMLVVTATEPGAQGAEIYLPAGTWVSYHTGEWLDSENAQSGPSEFYPEGRFRLPVFARAGAIIPLMFVDDQTMNVLGKRLDGSVHDELIVRVFADPTASEFTLFEDDGMTIAYQNGAVRQTVIRQQQLGEQVAVTIEPASGTYDGAPDRRDNVVRLSVRDLKAVAGVSLNGARLEPCGLPESVEGCSRGWYLDGTGQIVARSGPEDVAVGKTFAFQLVLGESGETP